MTAIAITHKDDIIARVAKGDMLKAIATDLGVTPSAICNQLHDDKDYLAAREAGALVRLETQYEALEAATDAVGVSRARECFRAAAWFAEREFPGRWAQRPPTVAVQAAITIIHESK